jgi:hypothetical protein
MYQVMTNYGQPSEMLFLASLVNDHETIVNYWCDIGDYLQALTAIRRQVLAKKDFVSIKSNSDPTKTNLELYYTYCSVLFKSVPTECVNVWIQEPHLDPCKLIPGLINHNSLSTNSLCLVSARNNTGICNDPMTQVLESSHTLPSLCHR